MSTALTEAALLACGGGSSSWSREAAGNVNLLFTSMVLDADVGMETGWNTSLIQMEKVISGCYCRSGMQGIVLRLVSDNSSPQAREGRVGDGRTGR
jgi:hypothetical protein